MSRLARAMLLAACASLLASCGGSPADVAGDSPPAVVEEDAPFIPPQDWCGTGRMRAPVAPAEPILAPPVAAPAAPPPELPAPQQPPGQPAEDEPFVPPQDWCGTGRVGGGWVEPHAGGSRDARILRILIEWLGEEGGPRRLPDGRGPGDGGGRAR